MHSSRTAARGEGRRSSAIAVSPSLSSARRLSKRRRDTSGTKAAAGDPPEHKQAKFYRGVTSEAWQSEASIASPGFSPAPKEVQKKNFTTKLPRTTLGTGLARTGTNTGTPLEPPKRLRRGEKKERKMCAD